MACILRYVVGESLCSKAIGDGSLRVEDVLLRSTAGQI